MDANEKVISAFRHLDLRHTDAWAEIENRIQSPELVAIDPVLSSISVLKGGTFSGLANVLLRSTIRGSHGEPMDSSLTIPALITGTLPRIGGARITNIQLRFGSPSSTGLQISAPYPHHAAAE